MTIGFDSNKYIKLQSSHILDRIKSFSKLYLEFGGKLFDDLHASRVLPGFDANAKVKMLQSLKDRAEIIFCINAGDIERNKMRADFDITYSMEVMRVIDNLRNWGIYVGSIVITQFVDQPSALAFKNKLEMHGENVYIHRHTNGYPMDINTIVSEEGYGQNPYIPTTHDIVVVTAPGPGSGKLATCLSQMYHDNKRGIKAGYSKFETFPIWNLPLKHPVNVAYEAATADLGDVNMLDYFHLEAHGSTTVNYNRDLQVFPVLRAIIKRIMGEDLYKSPTDTGVNMAGYCITDDKAVSEAACQEVIRRYYGALNDYKQGTGRLTTVERLEVLMNELNIKTSDRNVAVACMARNASGVPVTAIELPDGRIVTGKQSDILSASSSAVLNGIKQLAGIDDSVKLISPSAIDPTLLLNKSIYKSKKQLLTLEQTMVALSISVAHSKEAYDAFNCLPQLKGCEAHSTHILSSVDAGIMRKLGFNLTTEPKFASDDLYIE